MNDFIVTFVGITTTLTVVVILFAQWWASNIDKRRRKKEEALEKMMIARQAAAEESARKDAEFYRKIDKAREKLPIKIVEDFFFLILMPLLIFSLILSNSLFYAFRMSIFTTAFSYFVIAGFSGAIKALPLTYRFLIYCPVQLALICYWFIFVIGEVADGYGSGNVLVTLFGLFCAIVLTIWRIMAVKRML